MVYASITQGFTLLNLTCAGVYNVLAIASPEAAKLSVRARIAHQEAKYNM